MKILNSLQGKGLADCSTLKNVEKSWKHLGSLVPLHAQQAIFGEDGGRILLVLSCEGRFSECGFWLFLRPSEADHIPAVVHDLESSQAVAGVAKRAMHGDGIRDVLRIKRVGIGSVNVRIPARPFVAGMIGLGMNLRRDGLEHDHDAVALHDTKEIFAVSISATSVGDLKAQLGAIKFEACPEVVYDKKRRNGI